MEDSCADYFETYNKIQPGQRKSKFSHLKDCCALIESCAMSVVDEMENRDKPIVTAFFQIPSVIFLPNERFLVKGIENKLVVELEFQAILVEATSQGTARVSVDDGSTEFSANATQVIAFVPLWGKRERFYRRYQDCFSSNGMNNRIIVGPEESWRGGTPMSAHDFEFDICERISREIAYSTRHFLKSYSTITKRECNGDGLLYNYFVMTFPGRLASASPTISIINHFLSQRRQKKGNEITGDMIRSNIPTTYRQTSRFEKQIYAVTELADRGYYSISIASSLSLIEWILKTAAESAQRKFSNLSTLIKSIRIEGWSAQDYNSLDKMRILRNKIVHMGEYTNRGPRNFYEISEVEIDKEISEEDARSAINIAWKLFQAENRRILHFYTDN